MEHTGWIPRVYPQQGFRASAQRQMTWQACRTDDVSLMAQALSLAAKGDTRDNVQDILESGLKSSLKRKAVKVQAYLLDNGADVNQVHAGYFYNDEDPFAKPSLEAIEMVVAHGWDIDSRLSRIGWPLLWGVVEYPDLVEWCLDHGASVYLPGDTPPRDANGVGQVPRITLLESAAERGSVATFKLLREKGAPFHRGVLHAAVEKAVHLAPRIVPSADESPGSTSYNKRLTMIRYLIDEVGIDVDAEWWKAGRCGSTALAVAAWQSSDHRDVRELIWLLLDRGADINHVSVLKDGYKGIYKGVMLYMPVRLSWRRDLAAVTGVTFWRFFKSGRNDNVITRPDESRRFREVHYLV